MKQYLDLVDTVIRTGIRQANRTGTDTLFVPGAMLKFDLNDGFPAVTTKKLYYRGVVGELLGFLRGYTNAAQFRALGCNIWDKNANDPGSASHPNAWIDNPNRKGPDDLGRIYGAQWRDWRSVHTSLLPLAFGESTSRTKIESRSIDQLGAVLHKLYTNPTDRRMIINAWKPDEFDQMALPPCHVMYQFIADRSSNKLHLCLYQRSCDLGLGIPYNIASASTLLVVMAALTGFSCGTFTHFLADAHVYVDHIDELKLQIEREPKPLPQLVYTGPHFDGHVAFDASIFDLIEPKHFELTNYEYSIGSKMEMAT